MWFGKAVEDFNRGIQEAGNNAPQLIAATSNGFTSMLFCIPSLNAPSHVLIVAWVAYAFYAVPVICALARLHVTAGGKY
jgi:hypothetical protein